MARKGPGGKEVGRVSVRVVPDTSRFAAELKAQLEKIERQLEVKVPVKLDTKSVSAAAAKLRSSLPKIDMSSFDLNLGRTETLIGNTVATLSKISARVREASTSVADLSKRTVNAAKTAFNLRAHWQAVGAAIGRIPASLNKVRSDGLFRNTIRTSDAVLGLTARVTRLGATAGRVFAGLAGRAAGSVRDAFTGLASSAGRAASALGDITRVGWIVIAIFSLAAPLIGVVSSLLAGIPSLLLAGGAAVAAFALGFDGVKKAASQLSPQVDKLQASLSATFEKGLTPVFAQLGKVFPVLDKGLNNVASGLVSMAKSFTDVVISAQGLEQIQGFLDNTGKFLTDLAPTIRDGTSAFLTLAKAGSDSFGVLAGVLNTFAADFRAMVDRVVSDGSFAAAMQGLGQITGALLNLFTQLVEAGIRATGELGGPLSTLINGLTTALVALMPILTALSGFLGTVLGEALNTLAPVLTALTPAFSELASTIGELLVGALRALEPVLVPLAQIVNDVLLTALRAIQPVIGPLVGFFAQLGQIVGQFLLAAFQKLQPLLDKLVQFAIDLFTALQPLLPDLLALAQQIFTALLDVLIQLMPHLLRLADVVLPILVDIVRVAVPIIGDLLKILTDLAVPLAALVSQILDAVMPVFQALLELIEVVWPSIRDIIGGALEVIKGLINFVLGIITGDWSRAWEGIKQIFSGAWRAISGAVEGAVNGLIEFVRGIPGAIVSALGNLGRLLFDAGASIIRGLIDGIKSMAQSAVNAVGDLLGTIRDFLPFSPAKKGPFSGKGWTLFSGRALVADWTRGIEQGTPAAISAVEDMLNATSSAATAEWNGHISADGFGAIGDRVADALSQWTVQIDGNGLARLVNKANVRKARRG